MNRIISVIILLLIIGCTTQNKAEGPKISSPAVETPHEITFQEINSGAFYKSQRSGSGFEVINEDEGFFDVVIWLGKKNTGGFSLELINTYIDGKTLVLFVKENPPKQGAIVSQAFTRPWKEYKIKTSQLYSDIRLVLK